MAVFFEKYFPETLDTQRIRVYIDSVVETNTANAKGMTMTQDRISRNAEMLAKLITESGFVDEEKLNRHLRWCEKDFGVAIAQRIEAGVNLRIGTPGKVRIK